MPISGVESLVLLRINLSQRFSEDLLGVHNQADSGCHL